MGISDWPRELRPRERLLADGAGALSDAELLAVFLRVGVAGKDAVTLSRELLERFGSLGALCAAPRREFCVVPGLGEAKFAQLQAVLELARRAVAEPLRSGTTLGAPDVVKHYLRLRLAGQRHESFLVLFLDVKNRLLACDELFRGTLTHASVYPREVVKAALAHNAAAVMLAHNHPSGVAEPSDSDLLLTRSLMQALALVEVRVLDHFVVAGADVHSFAEHGQI
ncbi:MAG: RadC family protein [Telluria sp.]